MQYAYLDRQQVKDQAIVGFFISPALIEGFAPLAKRIFGVVKIGKVIVDRLWWMSRFVYNKLKPEQ